MMRNMQIDNYTINFLLNKLYRENVNILFFLIQ